MPSHPEPMPSSSSIRPGGTSQKPWRYRTTSPCCPCRRNRRNSTRSKTSGSSCAITGSQTGYSNLTMKLLITAASLGTSSSINLGKLCQADYVSGRINDSFCKLVLVDWYSRGRCVGGNRSAENYRRKGGSYQFNTFVRHHSDQLIFCLPRFVHAAEMGIARSQISNLEC